MFHFTLRTEAQKEDTVKTETSHSDMVDEKMGEKMKEILDGGS